MIIIRRTLFEKLNHVLSDSIESGTELCRLKGNPYVELVHWLNQLLQQEQTDLHFILRHYEIDRAKLDHDLMQQMSRLPRGADSVADFSYLIELAIERAWIVASLGEQPLEKVRSGHLLVALLSHPELRRALGSISTVMNQLSAEEVSHLLPALTRDSVEQSAITSLRSDNVASLSAKSGAADSALACYTTDLTALAKEGRIDPVLGRDGEITTIIDILLRRRQNNPLLTGDAGVGKTAVAEGLALAIVNGEVPPALAEVRLLALDIVALTAGASVKGEFEARLKSVLEAAAQASPPVIFFIDEFHTLVGAGGAAGIGDAANLMKPMLARGQIRTLGATTWSEFKRHIEKDPALTRRFQVVQIEEPSESLSVLMLRGLLPVLEKHHQVLILDEALQAAVRLSHRYIPARQLPDKAISLLDTACARVAIAQFTPPADLQKLRFLAKSACDELALFEKTSRFGHGEAHRKTEIEAKIASYTRDSEALEQRWQEECRRLEEIYRLREQLLTLPENDAQLPLLRQQLTVLQGTLTPDNGQPPLVRAEVGAETIAAIIAQWTGIPVGRVMKDELQAVAELPEQLSTRVVGQSRALARISECVSTARAGLADPGKPIGVFLLTGPSGTGKTETALALAEQLYGGEHNLITINMSEYQEAHTISTLKGSPPGYVGYGEGGVLTEAVRRKPYSVVLLDEIEKAHTDVHELFYQIFDKGTMEDGEGRRIDFRNTLILLTSNIGSALLSEIDSSQSELPSEEHLFESLHPLLLKTFPAAFLGRVTIIPYMPLNRVVLEEIAGIHLDKIVVRMQEQHGIALKYEKSVVSFIVDSCQAAASGAREIIHVIERKILPELAGYLLSGVEHSQGEMLTLILRHSLSAGINILTQYDDYKEGESKETLCVEL